MNKRVFVIGLGLIGGSIALAIRRAHEDATIIGFEINEERLGLAKTLNVIDEGAASIEEGAKEADLIVISAPVQQAEGIIETLVNIELKNTVIITDVGSTKQQIMSKAVLLHKKGVTFIGGHPMAGSHKSGVSAARPHLFENAFYILTPEKTTPTAKIEDLKNWLKGTKANFLIMSPKEHDELTGAVSHFPHIVAASLVHQVAAIDEKNSTISSIAAGGFRDITRIASSSPAMWRDILLHNKDTLLDLLEKWRVEMDHVQDMIDSMDSDAIYAYFNSAKEFRDGLPVKQMGAIPSFYDLYVDVPDHPGSISMVTSILAKEEISITNIRIIEVREDIMGVLRLSFRNEDDRKRAQLVLTKHQFESFIEM